MADTLEMAAAEIGELQDTVVGINHAGVGDEIVQLIVQGCDGAICDGGAPSNFRAGRGDSIVGESSADALERIF